MISQNINTKHPSLGRYHGGVCGGDTHPRTKTAFTLVEMLAVIGILAILIMLVVGVSGRISANAKRTETLNTMQIVRAALDRYFDEYGKYPAEDCSPLPQYGSTPLFFDRVLAKETNKTSNMLKTLMTCGNSTIKDMLSQLPENTLKRGAGASWELHDAYVTKPITNMDEPQIWYFYTEGSATPVLISAGEDGLFGIADTENFNNATDDDTKAAEANNVRSDDR